jgi:SAM-dependent methyltransferase
MLNVHTIDDFLHRRIGVPYLRLARERSIHERFRYALAVLDSLGLEGPTVLDVGCGSGMLLRHLASHRRRVASYTGIDLVATRLETRYRDVRIPHRFLDVDLDSDWQVPDNDFAWCSEVLEHLTDDRGVLRRIAGSVRPGGYVVVTMPSLEQRERVARKLPSALDVSPTQDGGHVRAGYTTETLGALAADAGLAVLRIDVVSPRLDFEFVSRYRSPRGMMELIDRIPFSRAPSFKFAAVPGNLARYISIAALLQRS